MLSLKTNICIANLRISVTRADVNYRSVNAVICNRLGIFDCQLLQIWNKRTSVDLWNCVIYERQLSGVEAGNLCLNGAAAHLVRIRNVVTLLA